MCASRVEIARARADLRSRCYCPGGIMSVIVEIRAAEGGLDAKDLVNEQFAVYTHRASRHGL